VANRAVNAPSTDNNGPGSPRSVEVDVSALGSFSSASLLTIDKDTNIASGPVAATVTPAAQMTITLNGYSVAFLTLSPDLTGWESTTEDAGDAGEVLG
jgi:hypothetical protein